MRTPGEWLRASVARWKSTIGAASALAFLLAGCGERDWVRVPGTEDALKSSADYRADRRLFDGAPPVIGHGEFGADCGSCHDAQGIGVVGVGYAPASPHTDTEDAGTTQRCRQCHVFANATGLFVENSFVGLSQDLRFGERLYVGAPPTIPHRIQMRENCAACHTGPAARAEIVTSHPERVRCQQCHVPITTREGILSYPDQGDEAPETS